LYQTEEASRGAAGPPSPPRRWRCSALRAETHQTSLQVLRAALYQVRTVLLGAISPDIFVRLTLSTRTDYRVPTKLVFSPVCIIILLTF
jgi:hypothetical protein